MTLTPDDRATFLDLLPGLAPGADAAGVLAFFRAHEAACLDELGSVPGFDQVRAGVLRILPAAVPAPEARAAWLDRARVALDAFEPASLTRAEALRRHPAWVAVCLLELAAQTGQPVDEAVARAEAVAAAGFASTAPDQPRGSGEVLWAIAEAAEEQGWVDHVDGLLERAARATFTDPENLGRVRLVQVLRLLSDEQPQAAAATEALLTLPHLDTRTRVHALWIGALLDQQVDRMGRAVDRLHEALDLVDADEDPDVAQRLRATLHTLGAGRDDPAEA
ncbi:MAG: hypothetical protein H6733_08295 [Alphaproteobacteria bacterium]|nr:hypothetical protein [Alphaproteobacteria bacterium]